MKFWLLTVFLEAFFLQPISCDPLKITVFYEALSPQCQRFITKQLYPAYPKLADYIDLDFVPFGNVKRKFDNGTWLFECQQGPDECTVNKLEACGLDKNNDKDQKLEFVYCVENSTANGSDLNTTAKCSSKLGLTDSQILQCALGPEGTKLLALLGDKQNLLEPNHWYVPWIDFNYQHDDDTNMNGLQDFLKTVCSLLDNKPKACSKNNEVPLY